MRAPSLSSCATLPDPTAADEDEEMPNLEDPSEFKEMEDGKDVNEDEGKGKGKDEDDEEILAQTVCGLSANKSFFSGGVLTLCSHISCNGQDHFPVYKKYCDDKKIPLNNHAYPEGYNKSGKLGGLTQTTLDENAKVEVPLTKQGLLNHIVEMTICIDSVLQFCWPKLADQDIPHRTKVSTEIKAKRDTEVKRLKKVFEKCPGDISLTFDTWTSAAGDPYLGITAHYIDSPDDQPTMGELKCDQIAFTQIEGDHSGGRIRLSDISTQTQITVATSAQGATLATGQG
ncbi:unnamed protein product [Mycena citricolor]|uniref:Uncharacterized protein n=1 Tax=Mycena citricolor TaxID=2018698 RepID=A0AAD2JWV6_9AGAR|nr:unnamed protein product [Mycena citricolor]